MADAATSVLVCATPFTFALLSRTLFRPYAPPRRLAAGIDLLLLAFPLQLAAMAAGYAREALWTNMLLIVASRWYLVVVAFALEKEQVPSRRLVRGIYLATALAVSALAFPALGAPMLPESPLRDAAGLLVTGVINGSLLYLVLYARSRETRASAQETALDLLVTKKALEMEHELKERAEAQARTDYLTGLASRRHFVEQAERELARAERYRKPLTLLMIDLDFFKEINDTRGHSVGDIVLQTVAARIRDALREVDIVGRVGGEEFAAILVESEGAAAMEVAQRLRKAVGGTDIMLPEGLPVRVTVSVGLTELRGREVNIDMLLAEADRALYEAKGSGRDSVRACEPA
jgi:diguanylate cyclase (GGDEF)-like protein